MSILIVDDEHDSRMLIKTLLNTGGYSDVILAVSAQDAFLKLDIDSPDALIRGIDLILMDVFMPGMDGIKACSRIKEVERLKDVPVIMVTGSTEPEDLQLSFSSGAVDYVTKPINKIELLARVRSTLRLKYEMDSRKAKERELVELTRQLEAANLILQSISLKDGLTGIQNRRYYDERIEHEWKRAERDNTPISLLLIDIDFFKAYNDTYGHQAGDECLKIVARTLHEVLKRPADFVARYGGEEFVAVLPETDIEGALKLAEVMRSRVEDLGLLHTASKVAGVVTICIGVAGLAPSKGYSYSMLVNEADNALYNAKRDGRNRANVKAVEQ
jgi:diguanylate cyclase (GGDEF)-like protein